MNLTEQIRQLRAEHEERRLSEPETETALRRLAFGQPPAEGGAATAELLSLRRQMALHSLQREFEEMRQTCMVRQRGQVHEPTLALFWIAVLGGSGFLAVLLYVLFVLRHTGSGPVWMVVAALMLGVVISTFRLAFEYHRKLNRLNAARAAWELNRRTLEELTPPPVP